MSRVVVFVAGLLFGSGVAISGMINPVKVLNFMDVAGNWDATLALVMAAGLAVTFVGYRIVLARGRPLFADAFRLPTSQAVDRRLIGGAALFGLGWGLTGFCPGPAIASLVFGHWQSVLFVAAMAAGSAAIRLLSRPATTR